MTDVRVYFADLAAYNAGTLHGVWVDLSIHTDEESIYGEIRKMLEQSPEHGAEEWAIHDYEGFGPVRLSEYMGIKELAELAELIVEHGDTVLAWISDQSVDYIDDFDADRLYGTYESERDWAWAFTEEFEESVKEMARKEHGEEMALLIKIDYDEAVMIAKCNWGWSFVDYDGKVYVFTQ
ncbi:antirestriction protein ArdA [Rhodococcus sp. ACS1]|uniref:antirestriction protein ArdA n=1 Tax=Rhodococcus sp. ACS1 TaxID=2028570 RepID=UPI0015CA7E3C|nr:antirestriction protein ArdA [Rhodococcus sp. ACS1]